jgi:hypothetical protein
MNDDLQAIHTGDQAMTRATDIATQVAMYWRTLTDAKLPESLIAELVDTFHGYVLIDHFGMPEQTVTLMAEDD